MKKKLIVVGGVILAVGIVGYLLRHNILDAWEEMNRPNLPAPVAFTPPTGTSTQLATAQPSSIEGGVSKSEHYALESSPQQKNAPVDPLASSVQLPNDINLDVPWMSQAPDANWDMPYQEACEEASMIMVDRFYKKVTHIDVADADKAVKDLVDYENKVRGDYKDTNAQETAKIIYDYFGYKDVRVIPFKTSDQIKQVVGRGYPVIIPFSGKDLKNPNFHNGGPLYHMLVIKGYTADGLFITDDPGTRKGKDYTYTYERIVDAAHDWNGGKVTEGAKFMIVVLPNVAQ